MLKVHCPGSKVGQFLERGKGFRSTRGKNKEQGRCHFLDLLTWILDKPFKVSPKSTNPKYNNKYLPNPQEYCCQDYNHEKYHKRRDRCVLLGILCTGIPCLFCYSPAQRAHIINRDQKQKNRTLWNYQRFVLTLSSMTRNRNIEIMQMVSNNVDGIFTPSSFKRVWLGWGWVRPLEHLHAYPFCSFSSSW